MQKVRMQIVKPTIECTVQFDMANGDNDAATPEHVPKNLVYKCQGARSVFGLLADVLCMPRGSAGIWLKVRVKPCRQVCEFVLQGHEIWPPRHHRNAKIASDALLWIAPLASSAGRTKYETSK